MYVWLENVNSGSFEVCIREFLPFDGKHQDTIVVSDMSSLFILSSLTSLAIFRCWVWGSRVGSFCPPPCVYNDIHSSNELYLVCNASEFVYASDSYVSITTSHYQIRRRSVSHLGSAISEFDFFFSFSFFQNTRKKR